MKILPNNVEPDKYLGKGVEFLVYLFVCVLVIILSGFSIWLIDGDKIIALGSIGSFLSGTIGPVVAILVAVFTFLAFYVQYDANKKIQEQFKVQQFESQFYKMLDLHKSNIDEMNITYYDHINEEIFENQYGLLFSSQIISKEILREVEGRKIFHGMLTELESCLTVVRETFQDLTIYHIRKYPNILEYLHNYAYSIFFFGLESDKAQLPSKYSQFDAIIKGNLVEIQQSFFERNKIDVSKEPNPQQFSYYPFVGHESRLSHYYRNLYAIVKLIVGRYDDDYGSENYFIARNYLKILRAQLSNAEQHLLYYNYRIGFGQDWDHKGWEEKTSKENNQFFTKYRMVHNLPVDRIYVPESPRDHFKEFICKYCSEEDELFEWGDNRGELCKKGKSSPTNKSS